ncbi:hypothetical protein FJ250_13770, partial [bacterium]|nr:hypothetical protein [bacterium]
PAGVPVLRAVAGLLGGVGSSFAFVFLGSLLGILVLFAPPIVVMGMTSPCLIRELARQGRVGAAAGRVFALSTVGSVLGTFLPVLIFIPALGTARTIVVFAGLLLAVVVLGLGLRLRGAGAAVGVTALGAMLALAALLPLPTPRRTPGLIHAAESAYQYLEVFDRGSLRFLAFNDALGFQTVANREGPLTGFYYDYYALLPLLLERPAERALVIGLGGGIIANQYRYFHPALAVDGVEIDPAVIDVAKRYFALNPATHVFAADGRIFAARPGPAYDVVVIDAYTNQIYVPFHLATCEFFAEVRGRLAPGGLVAMNVSAAREEAPLLQGICASLQAVFPRVYRLRVPGSNDFIVLASTRELTLPAPAGAHGPGLAPLADRFARGLLPAPVTGAAVLTDDRAAVERMVDWELLARNIRPAAAAHRP